MSAWPASVLALTLGTALLGTSCASTLEWTVAVGPTAVAELRAEVPVGSAPLERTTTHIDNTFPLADSTTTREGPAQPQPKSVSKGSDAPRVGTILGSIFAWLAGWFQ